MRSNEKPLPVRILEILFRRIAYVVADFPIFVIVTLLLFTAVTSVKIFFTKIEDDFQLGYTPRNARSLNELRVFKEFGNGEVVLHSIYVTAKDGGSMIRMEYLNETVRILDEMGSNLRIKNTSFYQFCTSFCNVNEAVPVFRNALLLQEDEIRKNGKPNLEKANVSFPIMKIFDRDVDLTSNLFGVKTWQPCDRPSNATSNIKEVHMIALVFVANRPSHWNDDDVVAWYRQITHHFLEEFQSDLVNADPISIPYVQDEIARTMNKLIPYLIVGFIIMCSIALISVYISASFYNQWSVIKISYALNACLCPVFSTGACLGTLFWCGYRFGSVLLVTPFLALAVGVDDSFIMINALQRQHAERKKRPVPNDSVRERLAGLLAEVGPSITITSLTNMTAFAISSLTPIPEVSLFCVANVMAMFFAYLYTITFYTAILALGTKYEMRRENNNTQKEELNRCNTANTWLQGLVRSYCEWLSNGFSFAFVLLLMAAYWSVSIYGALGMKPGITINKLFLSESPMIRMAKLRDEYFYRSKTQLTVFVNKVGNLSDPARIERINKMAEDFESLPQSSGPLYSRYWIREYEKFIRSEASNVEGLELDEEGETSVHPYSMESIHEFLDWPEYRHWRGFMKIDNDTDSIKAFIILFAYHGEEISSFSGKLQLLNSWRSVADNYSDELDASVFIEDAPFTDQLPILLPSTVQTSICTLICMTAICYLFMCSKITVLIASMSIVSIFIGVVGLMNLWGIDLDPITMSIIILSIGLSVDFPAHIAYHYHRKCVEEENMTTAERMEISLNEIGFPLIQCCTSTMFCIFSVYFVDCYMSLVLVKSVFIIVSLAITHALFVVPAVLCGVSRNRIRQGDCIAK